MFGRQMLRKIHEPITNGDGTWRIRINHELDQILRGTDIHPYTKIHGIARMDGQETFYWEP